MKYKIIFIVFLIVCLLPSVLGEDKIIVDIKILSQYMAVHQGGTLLIGAETVLIKEEENQITDVLLEYTIKDSNENTITALSETKGVLFRLHNLKEITIPEDIPSGIYSVEVKASYLENSGMDVELFEVQKRTTQYENKSIINYFIAIAITMLIFATMLYRKIKRLERRRR